MSMFVPDRIELHPRERIDDASEGLLRSCYRRFAWLALSLPRLVVLGLPSGGSLVAWLMARRVRRLASLEQQKLEFLASWIEQFVERNGMADIAATGDRPAAGPVPGDRGLAIGTTLAMALATGSLGLFAATLQRGVAGAFASPAATWIGLPPEWPTQDPVAMAFHAVAPLPFVVLGLLLLSRRQVVCRFVAWFNDRAVVAGLPVVHCPRHWWRWPRWIVATVATVLLAPPWATAMVVAGLLFVGYVRGTSDVVFVQFGESLRSGLERSNPGRFIPPRPDVLQRCGEEGCGVLRPDGVAHCPRCGANDARPRHG